MNNNNTGNRLSGMLGLCARARKLFIGSDIAVESVRGGRASLLLVASDASENTKKKVFNCARYYEVTCYEIPLGIAELGHCIGKEGNTAAVALQDRNMIKGIEKILNETNEHSETNDGSWEV